MQNVTLVRPVSGKPENGGSPLSSLPSDLQEQVRARLRLLGALTFGAFSLGLIVFTGFSVAQVLAGRPLGEEFFKSLPFQLVTVGEASAAAALWLLARNPRIATGTLHRIGLAFEIVICFTVAIETYWGTYTFQRVVPNLTWVPAIVIMFPLIMPGPPRRMLAASIVASGMAPLALLLLDFTGAIEVRSGAYVDTVLASVVAVGFAWWGAKIVYGLGREIAAARELGSYQLEELLGEGGMGQVWRARHRMLARPAAIKLIRAGPDGGPNRAGNMLRRFEREAQAIASLRSPHTVDLFDFGVANDGAFYYAMELLDGLDTDKLVRQFGPLPAERVIHILRQMCHSLSEADSRGLVHRDIKPANIFLCRYGEECDFVKVLDFGLVKALDDDAAHTAEHAVQGTPAFIAPEQAMGLPDLDRRVDIYATGCVAYWLLCGRYVFTAENAMALLMHHAHSKPERPSTRTELPIPEALESLVMACLEKDPKQRPQTARELGNRLAQVACDPPWTEARAHAWWSAHQPAVFHS